MSFSKKGYLKHPLKHTQFPPIDDSSVSSVVSKQKLNSGRGFFSSFSETLHESRRLQAARFIHQHRHLIDRAHKADAAKRTGAPFAPRPCSTNRQGGSAGLAVARGVSPATDRVIVIAALGTASRLDGEFVLKWYRFHRRGIRGLPAKERIT
jgi:hypothetical protein